MQGDGVHFGGTGRYRFIGRDGSLGYRTGRVYSLCIMSVFSPGESVTTKMQIERMGLQRFLHGPGYCPYDHQDKFFENWERV